MLKRTGVFASKEEVEGLKTLMGELKSCPVFAITDSQAMEGGFAGQLEKRIKVKCHGFARAKGLPEIEGYYGLEANGEFSCVG